MAEIGSSCTARVIAVCEGSHELALVEFARIGQSLDNVQWALHSFYSLGQWFLSERKVSNILIVKALQCCPCLGPHEMQCTSGCALMSHFPSMAPWRYLACCTSRIGSSWCVTTRSRVKPWSVSSQYCKFITLGGTKNTGLAVTTTHTHTFQNIDFKAARA